MPHLKNFRPHFGALQVMVLRMSSTEIHVTGKGIPLETVGSIKSISFNITFYFTIVEISCAIAHPGDERCRPIGIVASIDEAASLGLN